MKQICKFDPVRDVAAHKPNMSVDLVEAAKNGIVFDTGTLPEYNDIEEPGNVWRRVADTLDAVELQRTILKHGKIKSPADMNAPSSSSGNDEK